MSPAYTVHVDTPDEQGRFLVTSPAGYERRTLEQIKADLARGVVYEQGT